MFTLTGTRSRRSPAQINRGPGMRQAPSALTLAFIVTVLMVTAVIAHPAAAATPAKRPHSSTIAPTWQIQTTPNPEVKDETFHGISCTSSSNCVAVGDRLDGDSDQVTLAEIWNGSKWKMMSTPNPTGASQPELESVSCASAGSCVAVGEVGTDVPEPLAESWNGTSWAIDSVPGSSNPGYLYGVSCPTTSRCMAVGVRFSANGGLGRAAADSWNGSTWVRTKVIQPAGNSGVSLDSVSCPSAGSCEAVGGYAGDGKEGATLAETWNGTSWIIQKTPNPKGSSYTELTSVSCMSASDCFAVGLGSPVTQPGPTSLAELWNGTIWSIVSTSNPSGSEGVQLFGVSCSSATACAAVGENSIANQVNDTLAMIWNGKTWTIEPTPTPSSGGGGLYGVTCSSASTCMGVGVSFGSKGPTALLVESWDGETWSTQKARGEPGLLGAGLSGVSCLSTSFCLAVGSDEFYDPIAEIWNGSDWKVTTPPVGAEGDSLDDVSCITTTDCFAVGSNDADEMGLAEEWNGTSWTVLKTPVGLGLLEHVSCISGTSCMAVGSTVSNTRPPKPLAESWNGTEWTVTPLQKPAGSFQLEMLGVSCIAADACVAVGASGSDRGINSPLAYSWNGTKWTADKSAGASVANLGLTGVSCVSSSDCVAVGYSLDKLESPEAFSEIWNGSTWTAEKIPTPTGGAEPYSVRCSSETACVTVGARGSGRARGGMGRHGVDGPEDDQP